MGPSGQGYISDYYLNQNIKQGTKRHAPFDGGTGSGNDDHSEQNSAFNTIMN